VDFGMIHPVDSGKTGAAGRGALPYMAPEQIEMKDVTAATDIFALGVVAYEAFTGVQPFERGTATATVQAIRDEFPAPVSEINPAVNSALGQVVAKAMAKGPRNRFSSAREFAEYLQKALQDEAAPLFGNVRIQPRLERARRALRDGDLEFAHEILSDLQTETPTDSEIGRLLGEVKQAASRKAVRELLSSARMRLEESEFALAWQKAQEVIQKDPGDMEDPPQRAAE
jgi:serine/threonine-protein kinase